MIAIRKLIDEDAESLQKNFVSGYVTKQHFGNDR